MQAEAHQAAPAATIEPKPEAGAEPGTARALWPTFMRRTLAEEQVRETPRELPARQRC